MIAFQSSGPTMAGVGLFLFSLTGCQPPLEGSWSGYDSSGEALSLTFGLNQSFTMVDGDGDTVALPEGASMSYDVLNEVFPRQLYWVFEMGDTLRRREPLGIYKIEGRRLIICNVKVTQQTMGGIFPIGEPNYTWPTDFAGDCFGLNRN